MTEMKRYVLDGLRQFAAIMAVIVVMDIKSAHLVESGTFTSSIFYGAVAGAIAMFVAAIYPRRNA